VSAQRGPSRHFRALRVAALAFTCAIGLCGGALWWIVEGLGPLDLSAAEARSTVVVDRDGRLLRPFATPEGRWRLPV
jgi:penicillin-binding protein 1C